MKIVIPITRSLYNMLLWADCHDNPKEEFRVAYLDGMYELVCDNRRWVDTPELITDLHAIIQDNANRCIERVTNLAFNQDSEVDSAEQGRRIKAVREHDTETMCAQIMQKCFYYSSQFDENAEYLFKYRSESTREWTTDYPADANAIELLRA